MARTHARRLRSDFSSSAHSASACSSKSAAPWRIACRNASRSCGSTLWPPLPSSRASTASKGTPAASQSAAASVLRPVPSGPWKWHTRRRSGGSWPPKCARTSVARRIRRPTGQRRSASGTVATSGRGSAARAPRTGPLSSRNAAVTSSITSGRARNAPSPRSSGCKRPNRQSDASAENSGRACSRSAAPAQRSRSVRSTVGRRRLKSSCRYANTFS